MTEFVNAPGLLPVARICHWRRVHQRPEPQLGVSGAGEFPRCSTSPVPGRRNTAQITDGNGMTTSTDGVTTANVTGLGISGPDVNLLGGLGTGLSLRQARSPPPLPELPVPANWSTLASLITAKGVTSNSTIKVADTSAMSTQPRPSRDVDPARLDRADGLRSITVRPTAIASSTGEATIGGLTIAGVSVSWVTSSTIGGTLVALLAHKSCHQGYLVSAGSRSTLPW